jgi:hypothetical protein
MKTNNQKNNYQILCKNLKEQFKKTVALFILGSLLCSSSCSKSDSDNSSSANNYITCTINGVEFKSDEMSDGGSTKFNVDIAGTNNSTKTQIVIYFNRLESQANATLPLRYDDNGDSAVVSIQKIGSDGLPISADNKPLYTGTITFTKNNKFEVEGTFNASANSVSNQNVVTNGKFYMKFNENKVW